ncbi:dihydroxy-acid dehydratase [Streptosporangiaceae bacterium NEAU-GS5]|nr:dihydroxy-acid dehydratase [Streptosporangiaceae bacterium NEAU-GS5]
MTWFAGEDLDGFSQRSSLKGMGLSDEAFEGRPIIGIANSFSDYVHCNAHFRALVTHVRRGVEQSGGLALEFPVTSLGEPFMAPTTMLFRNLMAMDVEECVRAYPMDAVVLLGGCDKTIPAMIMGALSADRPAIMVPGGPQLNATFDGADVGTCTDCWLAAESVRAGRSTRADQRRLEDAIIRSAGHCSTMGTASTMASLAEAMGFTLAGAAATPAVDARHARLAERAGRVAVDLAKNGHRPSDFFGQASLTNAMTVLQALGGSTNAVVHLAAIAGRAGLDWDLGTLDRIGRETPWLVNLKPSGRFLMEDFFEAGGVPALLSELRDHLDLSAGTVEGVTLGERLPERGSGRADVIAPVSAPLDPAGAIRVVRGSLAPRGAVIKVTAGTPELYDHTGPAVVFDGPEDLERRLEDPATGIVPESVLILRGLGPVGAPGMPERGHVPIPTHLLRQGVTDMVRISDARMSGTAYGTCVLHVTPEAALGGPLALVKDGDLVRLDVAGGRLDLLIEEEELAARAAAMGPSPRRAGRGYQGLYVRHVLQADQGCDFDFLRRDGEI